MSDYDHLPAFPQDPAAIAARLARARRAGVVALVDVSSSMAAGDRAGTESQTFVADGQTYWAGEPKPGTKRIERLAKVLGYVLTRHKLEALIAFADHPEEIPLTGMIRLPEPNGSTNLAAAIEMAGGLAPKPTKLIVLSDGAPNSEELALRAMRALRPMPCDAYFIGAEGDAGALAFMEKLAGAGGPGGTWGHWDLAEAEKVAQSMALRITDQRSG